MDEGSYQAYYHTENVPLTCAGIANKGYSRGRSPATHARPHCFAPANMNEHGRWEAIRRLQWRPFSDGELTRRDVDDIRDSLPADVLTAISYWANKLASRLADIPELRKKSWDLLLQTVALGRDWFESVIADPTLIRYLETEMQPVKLHEVLS